MSKEEELGNLMVLRSTVNDVAGKIIQILQVHDSGMQRVILKAVRHELDLMDAVEFYKKYSA